MNLADLKSPLILQIQRAFFVNRIVSSARPQTRILRLR